MKKIKSLKGLVIAQATEKEVNEGACKYPVFTADEWAMGEGYRYSEWDSDSLNESIDFIKNY